MYINIQLHKNKNFFSNSGPFFRFCKTKKPGFPGFRASRAAFTVACNRKRLRRPSNPLSGRTRAFALANSKKGRVLRKQKSQRARTQKSLVREKSRSVRARKNPLSKVSNKNRHFRVFRKKQFKNLQQNFKNFKNV